jgi:Zn-dependent peptidase ImmA (M78 family)
MSQNKLLAEQVIQAKNDIRSRYIAGESVPSIAKFYGVSDRNIYYHLGRITAEEKGLHTQNADLRRQSVETAKRKEEHGQEPSTESPAQTTESSLSDFKQ